MFKKKNMNKYQMTTYSNVEDNNDIDITSMNDKILIQIIDVTDKTLIENTKLNELQAN